MEVWITVVLIWTFVPDRRRLQQQEALHPSSTLPPPPPLVSSILKCFASLVLFLHFYALPLICRINLFCIYLYSLIIAESLSAGNCLGLSPGGVF